MKLKTRQTVAKRVKITKNKKILKKKCGQNHFNAREKGSVTRAKRRCTTLVKTGANNNIFKELPYSI